MVRLVGGYAHSEFRRAQILSILQEILPDLLTIKTHYEYFIQAQEELSLPQQALLGSVLAATLAQNEPGLVTLWVIPRLGTLSAWGAKAVDILHHAGLKTISRIERALVYQLEFRKNGESKPDINAIFVHIHDRMTETVVQDWQLIAQLFETTEPKPSQDIPILTEGKSALIAANSLMGLALSHDEIDYLYLQYLRIERNPTDIELMMFAQANSEHCRHKIFNASWEVDGSRLPESLFTMIKYTYQCNSSGVLSAYSDNAAVIAGCGQKRFYCDPIDKTFRFHNEPVHLLMKVETHNHPTAIEPFAGAGTGQGGEIRDEGATGRGAKPKAGLTGFSVSNLHLPELPLPWEGKAHYPARISSALDIMLKGPLGGAAFNNEFGRPNLCGYFRTLELPIASEKTYSARGYHKPIMLAGGMGNIAAPHVKKEPIPTGALLIVLGGPAMKIGLGGGAASSMAAGTSVESLDFASVQRQNPEMQRRCQEVIDRCWEWGEQNPIISIHDVGAGGLANALPELVHDAHKGAHLQLRQIPNAEKGMSPLEIWCNESQERYVLAMKQEALTLFKEIADRERCPFALLGEASEEQRLLLQDNYFHNDPIDVPLSLLFGNSPKIHKQVNAAKKVYSDLRTNILPLAEIIERILQCPTVADKSFLITIGDRTVQGLTARDQMVGPWQIPVADCAVTSTNYIDVTGEAMSVGERAAIAVENGVASAKMAVGEAILNILSADVKTLADIRLSCNWMAAANYASDDADLYYAVEAVAKQLCPAWDITIPVGKDSLSMRTAWEDVHGNYEVVSPVTLVVSAFAPIQDIRKTLTPLLEVEETSDTLLLLVDLAENQYRLGGSIFAQVTGQMGGITPDIDNPLIVKQFIKALQELKARNLILAYHDRSDGGLWVTLCEMAFASHVGLDIDLSSYVENGDESDIAALFNEELGVVLQISANTLSQVEHIFAQFHLASALHIIAKINFEQNISISCRGENYYTKSRPALQTLWSKVSYHMQKMRDNPICAEQAFAAIVTDSNPGLANALLVPEPVISTIHSFTTPIANAYKGLTPKVAILREQGVNGHVEMAAAFTLAGFDAIDVTMTDLLAGKDLAQYQGLAVCGGFSYGDVLGAGKGWAKTILFQSRLRDYFSEFFHRSSTFTLGVCNGCQMLTAIKSLIPGAEGFAELDRNTSEQFEARLSLVEVCQSNSILLQGLTGAILPIAVSHGEGRVVLKQASSPLVALRYVDNHGKPTEEYPYNPNGSPQGITGFTTADGRVTIMMPHPERVFKAWQLSWFPKTWREYSPWMKLFTNARDWVK